uniref:Uncharacterized protein n=1 Tax=Glossina palpalis gambiensis TaxID=67801 RepID=A0A1B0AU57_9MUSC
MNHSTKQQNAMLFSLTRDRELLNKLDKYWCEVFNVFFIVGSTACSSCLFSDTLFYFTVAAALIYTMFILILTNVKQAERTFTDSYKMLLPFTY